MTAVGLVVIAALCAGVILSGQAAAADLVLLTANAIEQSPTRAAFAT